MIEEKDREKIEEIVKETVNGIGSKELTKEEIMAVKDRTERRRLIAENKELFKN